MTAMDILNGTRRAEIFILAGRLRKEKRGMLRDNDGGRPVVFLHAHSNALNDLENGWEEKESYRRLS